MSDVKKPEVLPSDPLAEAIAELFKNSLKPPPPEVPFSTGVISGLLYEWKLKRELRWMEMRAEIELKRKESILDKATSVTTIANIPLMVRAFAQKIEIDYLTGEENLRTIRIANQTSLIESSKSEIELDQMRNEIKALLDGSKNTDR